MALVLRTVLLTQARVNDDSPKWQNTITFLNKCFGVGSHIDSYGLQILETFKQVEFSKIEITESSKQK